MKLLVATAGLALVVGGCGGGGANTPPAKTTTSVSTGTAPALSVTGFGATDADWNGAHTEDQDFARGAVYDADPALPTVNGHEGAHYIGVIHGGGRVLSYDYMFPNRTITSTK